MSYASNTVVAGFAVEDRVRSVGQASVPVQRSDRSHPVVVSASQPPPGDVVTGVSPRSDALHGCFIAGVGSAYGRSGAVRSVVGPRPAVPYQCPRAESCSFSSAAVGHSRASWYQLARLHGQYDRGGLHQQAGRYAIARPVLGSRGPDQVLDVLRAHDQGASHSGGQDVRADALSRPDQVLNSEWSLDPVVFKQICRAFQTPHIDLFATVRNTKLPVFFSPVPEETALATDAMAQSWEGLLAIGLMTDVLNKVARSDCELLLVAPNRPQGSTCCCPSWWITQG